jgi:hypothetical protein
MSIGRPSIGFAMIVLTYGLCVAFFAWGLSTPPLDRVWWLHHELKIGSLYKLEREDRELLLSAMARHPALGNALLPSGQVGIISAHRDGWVDTPHVTIIRTPRSAKALRIVLDIQTPPQNIPYELEIDGLSAGGTHWEKELQIQARGVTTVDLPAPPPLPELVTLKFKGQRLRADPSSLGVRVTFDPPPDRSSGSQGDADEEDDE